MEGCPKNLTVLYMILSGLLNVFLFLVIKLVFDIFDGRKQRKTAQDRNKSMMSQDFVELQMELYGNSRALRRLQHLNSMTSTQKQEQ